MQPRSGEWVVVRSKEEILATLGKDGCLEGLPFMPEMFAYCGRRVRISSSAHKTCGPVQGQYLALQTTNLVHLGYRCDGSAHDGCQNGCQIFWHTAWLRPEGEAVKPAVNHGGGCTEADIVAATRQADLDGAKRYSCQALKLRNYAHPLNWWDPRSYWTSYRTGNHTLRQLFDGIVFWVFCKIAGPYGERFGGQRLYDAVQKWRGGNPFPRRHGLVPPGTQTPVVTLGLKPGDYVRIKSHQEILETLTGDCKNRGMGFDAELVPFCGRVFRVVTMVERFIDEEVGVMRRMKTPAAILENVYCLSLYTGKRAFCTRGYYAWWREAWLERVDNETAAAAATERLPCPAAAGSTPQVTAAPAPAPAS
jgi:hypothetical protein